MLTRTLVEGLDHYQIGPKLRGLRLKKKMGLVELGRHTGLSAALLSKVERGRLFPTLPTLLRIALVFGVGLDYFFTQKAEPEPAVVRRNQRIRFPSKVGAKRPAYHFESLDFPATERPMSAYFVAFEAVDPREAPPHQHAGAEVIYVIDGELAVNVGGTDHVLEPGDSMYLHGQRPHSYRRVKGRRCTAIIVIADQKG